MKKIVNDNFIIITILLGLAVRLLTTFLPGFHIDTSDWFAWANRLNEVGFSKFYSNQVFSDYTPGYMYVLSFLGFLKNLFQIDEKTFYFLLKLPAISAEIILGIIVYRKRAQALTIALILLNPALIFNSAIWGQIDSILALFLYLSIYYLISKKLILSSVMLGTAFLIKPQTVALFPVFLLFFIRQFSASNFMKLTAPFTMVILLLSLPFFITKPLTGLITLIINTANQYPYTSLFAYNFWGVVGFWISDKQTFYNLSYQMIGYILFSLYWIIILYFYLKKKLSLYALATLAFLGFYFLPTRVHERYLYPAIIFLIVYANSVRSKLLVILASILSVIHFLNLYYVYVYYNEIYLKLPKVLYSPNFYNFLDANGRVMSIFSTILFILISLVIIKSNDFFKKT